MKNIDEIRRINLRIIEEEFGGTTRAAERLDMSPAQFINLRDGARDSKTGKPRGMRSDTARRIEAAAAKSEGWLDTDHQLNLSQIPAPAGWEQLHADERHAIEAIISSVLDGIVCLPNTTPRERTDRRKAFGD